MINIMADNKPVKVEWLQFSDGALTCKVDEKIKGKNFSYISFSVDSSTPVKQVSEEYFLLTSALYLMGVTSDNYYVSLPYLPYGRADRVFEEGNPNPLGSFLSNFSHVDRLHLVDAHNLDAVYRYINKDLVTHTTQLQCFKEVFTRKSECEWDYVIAPDNGAKEKAKSIADWLGVPCVQANKDRDIKTGRIVSTTLDIELPANSSVIIVDDILDGGGTFIPLANKVRSQGCSVDLYVTHLIAAKGLDLFKGVLDNIYCWHTVGKYINKQNVTDFNLGK